MCLMKTVTLKEFKQRSHYHRMAHEGHPVLVTLRGKPYFIAIPPTMAETFVGAACAGKPLSPDVLVSVLTEEEWKSSQ
jgi:hypothetical protein